LRRGDPHHRRPREFEDPTLGAVVLYAAAITRGADGRGLLLDTLHYNYNAAEAELTTARP
jgi:hypothetical protein